MDPLFKEHLLEVAEQQGRSSKSLAISESRYNQIVNHLSNPSEKVDSHFKSWVKGRKFQLLDLLGTGLKQVLVIPNDKANKANFICNFCTFNPVTLTHVKTIGLKNAC